MSATLVITKDHVLVQKAPVGNELRIGRSPKCQVALVEPMLSRAEVDLLSREHILICEEAGAFWIEDLKSRNGTFLGGERLSRRTQLQNGDEITIGGLASLRIKMLCDPVVPGSPRKSSPAQPPSPAEAPTLPSMPERANAPERPSTAAQKQRFSVKLTILEGPSQVVGTVFENWQGALNIGRARENEVMIPASGEDGISAFHAKIERTDDKFWLVDCKSKNGTLLDGRRIDARAQLFDGQKIYVGKSRLSFSLTDLEQRRRRLQHIAVGLGLLCVVLLVFLAFRPPDRAAENLRAALTLRTDGKLDEAKKLMEQALELDRNRPEVRRELDQTNKLIQRRKNLEAATQLARHATSPEAFEDAKKLCVMVLNDFRNDRQALDLKSAIDSVQAAEVAIQNQNWNEAINKLTAQLSRLPESELLKARLARAQGERETGSLVAGAREFLARDKITEATELLNRVKDPSSHYTEEKARLEGAIASRRKFLSGLQAIRDLYQRGVESDLGGAQAKIRETLAEFPGTTELIVLQDRVSGMEKLAPGLRAAEGGADSDNIPALLGHQKACQAVLAMEQGEWVTEWRKRGERTTTQLAQQLKRLATDHCNKASAAFTEAQSLEKGSLPQLKRLKDSVEHWNAAGEAGYLEAAPRTQRDSGRDQIRLEAQARYSRVYALIQQGLARHSPGVPKTLREILEFCPSSEEYRQKAQEALKQLGL